LFGPPGWAALTLEKRRITHDVYENTSTYRRFMQVPENCIWLMINNLSYRLGLSRGKKGELKMKGYPTMLLKTHVEKMSV
jgi:hypothetical protein